MKKFLLIKFTEKPKLLTERTLKIFVKNPELGKVKTRLAVDIGEQKALEAYIGLLNYTKEISEGIKAEKEVWYSGWKEKEDIWEGGLFQKKVQQGKDLGERMKAAFRETFLSNEKAEVILIGSDCAELDEKDIKEAFDCLKTSDLVIGPATDGGYYLIGMSKFIPEVFDGIEWSTTQVLEQTLIKTKRIGVKHHLMKPLNDVDVLADWNRAKKKVLGL